MKRISQSIVLVAFTLAIASATAANQPDRAPDNKDNPVLRMSNGSNDGDKTYYTIWCKNNNIGSVVAEHDKQHYCALPEGGKRHCNKGWSLMKASIKACQKHK